MGQYPLLNLISDHVDIAGLAKNVWVLLPEHVEECPLLCVCRVERPLNGNNVLGIVFLIVGEYHQLRDVQERAKRLVAESRVDALAFGKHPLVVVGFLDFDKGKRKAIHKARNVRAKVVMRVRILARELGGAMPEVIVRIVEVYVSNAA